MISSNYSAHQTPQFRVLSDRQCQALYLAALECLDRVGVQVNNAEARALLAGAGARLDGNRVYLPAHILQDALQTAPRTFTLWGRQPQTELQVAPERVYFGPGPTCTYFQDPETGERRRARRGDAALVARVCDALPGLDYAMGLSLFDDVQPELASIYEFAELIANTGKPVIIWAPNPAALAEIYAMAAAVAGGEAALQARPNFAFFGTYKSPLQHKDEDLANLFWAAEHSIPVIYLGGPTVGLESPVTGASALVLHLAAALSGLAMVQLKRRGAPMAIGGVPSAMDLRTARPAYGSPEMVLHTAACADLARFLGLPFMGTAGATESKRLDAQAGVEAALQILVSALSGAGIVHDLGFLDCADIGSLGYLVLIDEIIAMVRRIMRGVVVDKETLMLDLIEQVGPGGNFLGERRSVQLCRREIWVPTLMDRDPYFIWDEKGAKGMEQRVGEKLAKILKYHQPPPLPPGAAEQIEAILHAVEQRTRG